MCCRYVFIHSFTHSGWLGVKKKVTCYLFIQSYPLWPAQYVEYGARSQEPPQPHPDAARSLTPSMPMGGGPPPPINPARSTPMDLGLGPSMSMPTSMGNNTSMAVSAPAAPPPTQAPSSSSSQPPPPPPPSSAAGGATSGSASGGSRGPAFPKVRESGAFCWGGGGWIESPGI